MKLSNFRPVPSHDLGSPTGTVGARRHEPGLDDWLGDVSDDDWSEGAARRPAYGEPGGTQAAVPTGDPWPGAASDPPEQARPVSRADARRAAIERRRYTAGLVLFVAIGLAVAIPVLLLRGGGTTEATSGDAVTAPTPTETGQPTVPATTTTTPTSSAAEPDSTTTSPTTPSTTPTTTAPTTTAPTTTGSTTFTLPEGTKLQLGENDPALVRELQQALITAGYDPGPADGTYGSQTEAAVVAFQQANGLSVDGRVGPETASALNAALATG